MSEPKHTPGPWTDDTRVPVYGFYGLSLVITAPPEEMEVAKANARLLIAAPDLLAACKAWKAALETYLASDDVVFVKPHGLLDQTTAAISKAEAKQ